MIKLILMVTWIWTIETRLETDEMKIKRIFIEVELEKDDDHNHATVFEFVGGMWISNSTFYSRIGPALHTVWL